MLQQAYKWRLNTIGIISLVLMQQCHIPVDPEQHRGQYLHCHTVKGSDPISLFKTYIWTLICFRPQNDS